MNDAKTHLRRSLHPMPGREGKPKRDVAIVSWYDQGLQTWQASSPDFPHLADARAVAKAALSPTRRVAVTALLGRIVLALQSVCRPTFPVGSPRGSLTETGKCGQEGTRDARDV